MEGKIFGIDIKVIVVLLLVYFSFNTKLFSKVKKSKRYNKGLRMLRSGFGRINRFASKYESVNRIRNRMNRRFKGLPI